MYAVIKTGGKQYRVAQNDVLTIEKLDGEAGAKIEFTEVLMVGAGDSVKVGTPTVAGAKVIAELVEQTRGPKLIAFKKRRRKNSRRKHGHRQDLTKVRITEHRRRLTETARSTPRSLTTAADQQDEGSHHGTEKGRRLDQQRPRLALQAPRRQALRRRARHSRQHPRAASAARSGIPGRNVGIGTDHTIFAVVEGVVKFETKRNGRTFVSSAARSAEAAE